MKTNRLKGYWKLCWPQLLMMLCGLLLAFFPETAVELVNKAAGWILVVTGIYNIAKALSQKGQGVSFWIRTVVYVFLGSFLLIHPMRISALLGRIVGVLLMIQGVKDLRGVASRMLGVATLLGGVILFLIPNTLTNALLILLGVVLIVVGGIHLVEKLFRTRRLGRGGDADIIDAAP